MKLPPDSFAGGSLDSVGQLGGWLFSAFLELQFDFQLSRFGFKEFGISEEEFLSKIDKLSELAHQDQCTGTNPRYPLISEIKDLYLKSYYGEL